MSTFFYVPQYFTTQLSVAGGIDDTQTTGIVLQDISGVDDTKPGIIALTWSNPIDTTKIEYIFYTSINSSTKELQGVTRGQEGYSAKSHLNGATVAWPLSKSHINNIPDSTTTFTNKTLTSPKINENVAITTTSTELNLLAGQTVLRKQMIHGSSLGVPQPSNTTRYIGSFAHETDAYIPAIPFSMAGTIKNLMVITNNAPGVGQTYTFTLMKENSAQTVTCTNSGNVTNIVVDTTHSFTVAANDRVSLRAVSSATANTISVVNFSFEFNGF